MREKGPPCTVNQVVIQEDIAHGERVRGYVLEGRLNANKWKKLAVVESIGHKRIERIAPIEVAEVRLRVTNHRAEPRIRNLQAFAPPKA